jgi:hypothetical protein
MHANWSEHLSPNCIGSFRALCISTNSLNAVRLSLESQQFRTYLLDTAGVNDKASLLQAIVGCFRPPASAPEGLSSWDAAPDLVWQTLMERPEGRVALLWLHADHMLAERLQLVLDSLEMLEYLGNSLERQKLGRGCHPVIFRIVLLGEGTCFPPWQQF